MELGNMMFGNSRGEFEVPRGQGFEEELHRLFNAYAKDRDNSWREYGVAFENEVFHVFPYYWGDCDCGYDERFETAFAQWSKTNCHAVDCYQSELRTRLAAYDAEIGYKPFESFSDAFDITEVPLTMGGVAVGTTLSMEPKPMDRSLYDKHQKYEAQLMTELCKRHNLSRKFGAAVHCTCGYDEKYSQWAALDGHSPMCSLVRPNFFFRPKSFTLNWYKYPLRDAYMNQRTSLADFRAMVDECIASLRGPGA